MILLALLFSLATALPAVPAAPLPAVSPAIAASPSPATSPTPNPWDECEKSQALPYDHPIGLKMRVLDGPDFDLTKYRGQAVLLNLFATWCGPCNHEMPGFVRAAQAYADRGLRIISIDDRETDDAVRAFRKKYGISNPIAMDVSGGLTRALEVQMSSQESVAVPVTLFIDPNGYLYCERRGGMSDEELTYRIDHFLTASAPILASPAPTAP